MLGIEEIQTYFMVVLKRRVIGLGVIVKVCKEMVVRRLSN